MRLEVINKYRQGFILIYSLFLFSCMRNSEEVVVTPPPTNPLVRDFIGYGVVNVSFIHLISEPRQDGTSLGYLRKGSLVKIIERRTVPVRGKSEIWVLVDAESLGNPEEKIQGWLMESSINVYDNESRALTAAEVMTL